MAMVENARYGVLYEEIIERARKLSPEGIEKTVSFMDYVMYMERLEELEDAKDVEYAVLHKNDPVIPFEQALKELGLE